MKFLDILRYFNPFRRDEKSDSQSDKYTFDVALEAISEDTEVGTNALIEKGSTDGQKDLPPQNWEGLNVTEEQVVKAYQRLIDAETKAYDRDQRELISKLKSFNPRLFPSDEVSDDFSDEDHSIIVDQAKSDMETTISENKPAIENKLTRVCDVREEYQAFKDKNKLNYDLDLPVGWRNKLKPWLLLFGAVLVESVINGWFFKNQADGKFIEFIWQAFLIAAVNVCVIGLLIRSSWKYLYHIRSHLKIWAVLGLVIFSLTAFTFNLGAAHFRDAIPEEYPDSGDECFSAAKYEFAGQEALCLLWSEKTKLADFQAYAFFILGIGFILFGVFKWMDIFPGYPGHAKKQRQLQEALKDLDKERDSLISKLEEIYKIARQKLSSSSSIQDHQAIISLINGVDDNNDNTFTPTILDDHKLALKLRGNIQDKYKDMRNSLHYGAQHCVKALTFYRKANRAAREDIASVPSDWDQQWIPDWYIPEDPGDVGLCSSEYAESLHDRELMYIEGSLDPSYRKALEKVDLLSKPPQKKEVPIIVQI